MARIAGLKCLDLPKQSFDIWNKQIKDDIEKERIVNVQRGFDRLLSERAYGGLDYAIFFEGAKITAEEKIKKNNKLAEGILNG